MFNPQSEWSIPTFAFPAIADTHLPTPEGWKVELAWVAGYVVIQFTCPTALTHPSTNQAQCSATALIETDTLPPHWTTTWHRCPVLCWMHRGLVCLCVVVLTQLKLSWMQRNVCMQEHSVYVVAEDLMTPRNCRAWLMHCAVVCRHLC